jgi:CoA-transferase family III
MNRGMTDAQSGAASLLRALWSALGGNADLPGSVTFEGPADGLPSIYAVSEFAAAQIGAAALATAELLAARTGEPIRASQIDRRHACAAFRSERYLRPIGWKRPAPWDPIAGDYQARTGWIRLHTNYASHREAALSVLKTPAERESVATAVLQWEAGALEEAVVRAGGAAAAMHSAPEWSEHPQGEAVAREPLIAVEATKAPAESLPAAEEAPLGGIRVLDLTRVIAGPVCTRFLAAYGADVMRIDPPGFEEVGALLAETTAGKRRAALDLRDPRARNTFERLIAQAHVLVSSLRADALERLGFSLPALRALNPALIVASIDAYGHTGPWRHRRGFDSLVQMSCGIAAAGQEASGATSPVPLPAQALDHGTGYLLAAAVCRALTRRIEQRQISAVRASLARTAQLLMDLGEVPIRGDRDFTSEDAEPWLERADSAWGPLARVSCPGRIAGTKPGWARAAGPLGTDPPEW